MVFRVTGKRGVIAATPGPDDDYRVDMPRGKWFVIKGCNGKTSAVDLAKVAAAFPLLPSDSRQRVGREEMTRFNTQIQNHNTLL